MGWWGQIVFCLYVVVAASSFRAQGVDCAESILLGGVEPPLNAVFERRAIPAGETIARRSAVIPEYNPDTDLIFHYRADGHTSFYVGNRRFNWAGHGSRHVNKHIIEAGLAVVARIGVEKVKALVESIDAQRHFRMNAVSCHHSEIAYLQKHGIFVGRGNTLVGVDLFRRVIETGFVDETGAPFPKSLYAISSQANLVSGLWGTIHQIQGDWLWRLFEYIGLDRSAFQALRTSAAPTTPQAHAREAWLSGNFAGLDAPAREHLSKYMRGFNDWLTSVLKNQYGLTPEQALGLLADLNGQLPNETRQLLKTLFETAVIASVKDP